jgi:hypothetical protein
VCEAAYRIYPIRNGRAVPYALGSLGVRNPVQDSPNSGVNETNPAFNKLKRVQELWEELGRTKVNSAEYQDIMKNIRALSAEYQSLVEASAKPGKSK